MTMLSSGRFVSTLCGPLALLAFCTTGFGSEAAATAPKSALTFERDIRPILRAHCLDCHGAEDEKEGNLDLRLVHFMTKGGDSGPALVPGQTAESVLLERIRNGEMPPGEAKVPAAEIQILEQWIAAGAPTARPEPETLGPGLPILPEERDWWAFRPLQQPEVPKLPDASRVRTPIDAFLLAAMPDGLSFSPDADKMTQMRRLYFDLIGLPPTPEQVTRYMNDNAPDAYERLVEELLQSPHYGERWSRHWLDIAGYADSDGRTNTDAVRQWAYRYRDYVIHSLNNDKPFDRFLHEQLAGDELAGPIKGDLTAEQIELLTATGFLRTAADGTGSGDNTEESRNQVMADTIKIVSTSLLGLSVACAQCHDHRYDPISQVDYFALRAVFEPALDWKKWKTPQQRFVSLYTQADRDAAAKIEEDVKVIAAERAEKLKQFMETELVKELEKYEEPLRSQLRTAYDTPDKDRTPEQKELLMKNPSVNITPGVLYQYNQASADELKKIDDQIAEMRSKKPREEFLSVLMEPAGQVPETKLFYRGDYRQPKQTVAPAALTVLCPEDAYQTFPVKADSLPTTGRRLAFAQWLTSDANPITPRVLVNRIWLHHFGRGLVESPADFGKLGMEPSHPELLDWLATEFRDTGWSLKRLHKTIVLSTAYRQAARRDVERDAIDSDNRYYSRKSVLRLDAEVLRDRVLAATGQLDLAISGPPVPVKVDETGQAIVEGTSQRRSLYIQQRRSQPVSMLQAFDAPVMETNCERRPSSTVATQSLMLMNSQFVLDQSLRLAERAAQPANGNIPADLLAGLPALAPPRPPVWQFGYGSFEEAAQRTSKFTAFPHWTNGTWQGSDKRPDPAIGWSLLHASGGHTGNNPDFAPIRRWTATVAGKVSITGQLKHPSPNGDGVRGRIVSSRTGLAGEWIAQNSEAATQAVDLAVEAGDTIDLITDCRADVNSDSFNWTADFTLTPANGEPIIFNTVKGFHGPQAASAQLAADQIARVWLLAYCRLPTRDEMTLSVEFINQQLEEMSLRPRELPKGVTPPQQALANLSQALLTSNEFLYVD